MNSTEMDRFSEACGATGPLLVDVRDDGETHRARRIFHQPFLLIGRHPGADLELRHEQAGTRHCYWQLIDGRVFCIDLGVRAGLRIDGTPRRTGWLDRSRMLQIGPVGLSLQGGDRGLAAPDPESPGPLSARYARQHRLPAATLEIASAGAEAHRWPMNRVLVLIGRSPACKVKLISPAVSEIHCALLRTPSGVWLIDLLSQEGVAVDGVPARACRLDEGAELSLGPFSIRVRYESQGPARGARPPLTGRRARHLEDARPVAVSPWSDGGVEVGPSLPALASVPSPGGEGPGAMPQELRQVVMMAQMFEAMHRDHMDVVREEHDEIRRLAEEIHALRSDLRPRPAADSPAASPASASPGVATDALASASASSAPRAVRPGAVSAGGASRAAATGRAGGATRAGQAPRPSPSPSAEPGRGPVRAGADLGLRRDPRELHVLASEFLASYQLERRSLREKILRILVGPSRATE